MDFGDELPCGGYENEDKKIQQELEAISLGKECQECEGKQSCCKHPHTNSQSKEQIQKSTNDKSKYPLCKKCKQNHSVLLHKNQPICRQCLLKNVQYKCRLNLQNKVKVKQTDNILVCFSGGLNSIALANIMSNLQKRYQKHHLFASVKCIHILQQQYLPEQYQTNFKNITGIQLEVIKIQKIFDKTQDQSFQKVRKLLSLFKQSSETNDLLQIFRDRLIKKYAVEHKYQHILKANNGQNLAIQIFRKFAKGIGGNIVDLCDYDVFAYPLRQHLQKQIQYYFHAQKLSKLALKAQQNDLSNFVSKKIDTFLTTFITNLQNMYSHTSPAIVRTAEKIQSKLQKQQKCKWCDQKGVDQEELCRRCERIKQGMLPQANQLLPSWMK